MKKSPSVKLEVDPSIIERNLIITDSSSSPPGDGFDPISQLLGNSDDKVPEDIPWKYVLPTPGFCVKTHTLEGDKVFVNICHSDEIPPPREISDDELISILESDDAVNYTVPLSLGDLHVEADKSCNTCSVYDVLINTSFYNKILKNQLFKTFFMTVVMEGIESKYKLELTLRTEKPYVILKNRKHLGTLQSHRIQQRKVKEGPKKLIEVISSVDEMPKTAKISELPVEKGGITPLTVDDHNKLRLFVVPGNGEALLLLALVRIKALTGNDIEIDVSSRRLFISCARNETMDCVLPYSVQPENSVAQYFVNLQAENWGAQVLKVAGSKSVVKTGEFRPPQVKFPLNRYFGRYVFNCYDISRACVEGLVKRSRERNNSAVKHHKRRWTLGEPSSESEEATKKRRFDEKPISPSYDRTQLGVALEEYEEEDVFTDVEEAAVVEIVQTHENEADETQIKYEALDNNGAAGVLVSADDNMILELNDESVPACSDLTCDVYTQDSEYSDSEPNSSESTDDLDDSPRYACLKRTSPGPSRDSGIQQDSHLEDSSRRISSSRTSRPTLSRVVSEDEDVYENQESLEEKLLKIYSTSYFKSKDNAFKVFSNPYESIDDEDDGTHSMSSSNALKIIKSAFKLCRFADVKAYQVRRLLIGTTNDLNDLEDILIEHLSSLMCFSGTEFFQKCFGQSLREAIETGKSSDVRSKHAWSEEEIVVRGSDKRMQLAVALQCYSGKAYSALGELVDLPGPHITRKWATNFDGYPGFSGQSFAAIRDEVIRLKEETVYVCLSMEDVPLRKAIQWEDSQITGFTDLGFGRVESDGIPEATRAVVFYASALNSNWKMPVGYCFSDYLSPQVRSNLLCQYISKLEFCGVKCIGVVLNDSVTTTQIFDEFGVFVKGALPQGSFYTNADEKFRVSPFVDIMELMRSIKFLLKEKKVFITPTGVEIMWIHIQYAEELFESDSTDWVNISGRSSPDLVNHLKLLKEKIRKDKWPFGKYLLIALKILRKMGVAEFINSSSTISFVSEMVKITKVFTCPNRFLEDRLVLPNNKDTFATVNKWIHYVGNMKYLDGIFIRDSDRKMPLMNLCMNLSSLKVVVRRTFDSSQDGLFNRFSLDNVKQFITQMGFGRDTPLPTPSQFRDEYFRLIVSVSTSGASSIVYNRDRSDKCESRLKIDSTYYVTETIIYSPLYSMCDCVEDFFLEKVVNIWMESVDCTECYEIMLETMQNFSILNPGVYKDLLSAFRKAERLLCLMEELPADLMELGPSFSLFANSVLSEMTAVGGFKLHGHLFNSVEFGETCHFTHMVKDMLKIYVQLRLLYLSREIKIGIHDFQKSSLKYSVGQYWA